MIVYDNIAELFIPLNPTSIKINAFPSVPSSSACDGKVFYRQLALIRNGGYAGFALI